jgi:PASTA domain-containing protein
VERVGASLPAGYEFRREARHDLDNEGIADPLPDVTGLFYVEGWNILHNLGYVVNQENQPTTDDLQGLILSQEPAGGTPDIPPGPVTIWVGSPFPHQPPHIPPDTPIIE